MHHDIIEGLLQPAAQISPKYFYDQRGSELFEAITRQPEYYPTRTEKKLLLQKGPEIQRALGTVRTIIEPGAGNVEKGRVLCRFLQPECFVGIDISAEILQYGLQALKKDQPQLDARAVTADLTRPVSFPPDIPAVQRLVFHPGSSIGNYDPPQAVAWLCRAREWVDETGGLLIGIDLPKSPTVLEAAYNDSAGVTARFNLNVLSHLNQLIGSDFDLAQWKHCAFFNAEHSRIEMHLECLGAQRVSWRGGQRRFEQGERILTEYSYKYPLAVFTRMLREGGFSRSSAWTDERSWFALIHARP